MKHITTRQFSVLGDCGKIYQFMLDIYERDWRNGVPAPFFEYAFSSFAKWMDISYSYLNRIWEDNGEIVAFCFYENPVTDIYFSLKPGYEELAPQMAAYADEHMLQKNGERRLILFGGQTALINAAKELGYRQVSERTDMQVDFEDVLDYPLPEGFHFVKPEEYEYQLQAAPHATTELAVIIADEQDEYVCYAGMWWIPQNKLAYMEPLCTVPEYRNRGLAAAALSEMYRKTKKMGATHMTGGFNGFYQKIGYRPAEKWTYWKKL